MNRSILLFMVVSAIFSFVATAPAEAQSFVETVKTGNIKNVKKLLGKKKTSINEQDSEGLTGLIVAVIANDSTMADLLLGAGADPNIASRSGMTALHAAAFHSRDQVAPLLIASGANPNVFDSKGRSPLLVAATVGATNVVSALIQAGADIEYKDRKGNSALMLACAGRHLGTQDELLEKGANPNTRDLLGRTPAMLLCVLGEDEMLRILIKYKADLTLVDYSLKTALAYAKENRRKACIAILEQAGTKY